MPEHGDSADSLLELVKREHCNIPAGAWGFFFPVTIALWRWVNEMTGNRLGEVRAIWTDNSGAVPAEVEVVGDKYLVRRGTQREGFGEGPLFVGPGGAWLVGEVSGGLLDAVEALSYAIVAVIPREKALSGRLQPTDIGQIDRVLVTRLVLAAEEAVGKGGVGR